MRYTVLTDNDVQPVLPMSAAADRIEFALAELGEIVVGKHPGRQSADDITLFCTAGLSGTEGAVASEALRRAAHAA